MTLAADVVTYLIKAPPYDRQSSESKLRDGLRPYTKMPQVKQVMRYIRTILGVPTHTDTESVLSLVNTSRYENSLMSHLDSIKYDSSVTRWLVIAYVNDQPYAGSVISLIASGYIVIENIILYPLPFMASFVTRIPDVNRLIQPAASDIARKEGVRVIYKIANENEGLSLILKYGYVKTNFMHTYMKWMDDV